MSDDADERITNLSVRLHEAEEKLARIARAADDAGLDSIALEVARVVDDLYAQAHSGTAQRRARVQIVIREAMRANLEGATRYTYQSDLQQVS